MCNQSLDSILIKEERHCLYTYPLDSYWTKKNPKPNVGWPNTGCRRGYVATWELSENSLYLIDLLYYSVYGKDGLDYVFPNQSGKIKANWFTGELRIAIGDYLYFDDGLVYESDMFLMLENGTVISHRYKANY